MGSRQVNIFLGIGVAVLLVLGFAFWRLNRAFYVLSRGARGCGEGAPDSFRQRYAGKGCGVVGKNEEGATSYAGVLREAKKIGENYYLAVDFSDSTRWFYLGEGDKEGKMFVTVEDGKFGGENLLMNERYPGGFKLKLDEKGIGELGQYKGSYISFFVFSREMVNDWMLGEYEDVESGISREQFEAFKDYSRICYEEGNLLGRLINFCQPYMSGLKIYE